MKILDISNGFSDADLKETVAVLRTGGLVVYPTETTYGIGAEATNAAGVQKLLQYKARRAGKALSVVAADMKMAGEYVVLSPSARRAYETFLPGPVTVVSQGKHAVADGVESEDGTLGIRIPAHEVPIQIVRALGKPITATGANASNEKRPYAVADILANTSQKQQALIDLILDAGTLPPNPPSTVIDTTLDDWQVLRYGSVGFEEPQEFISHSPEETQAFAKQFVKRFASLWGEKPVIFALSGEMGVGKTQFTKGLALGLGITDLIKSPTYTFVEEYSFRAQSRDLPFLHIDAWRIESVADFALLGIEDSFAKNPIISLEWASLTPEVLEQWAKSATIIPVEFSYDATDPDARHLRFESKGLV